MAGVDSVGLGEVPQNVLVSFSLADRVASRPGARCALSSLLLSSHDADHAVSSRRTLPHKLIDAETNARPRRPPARDAATNHPAQDAAPHLARGGSVNGHVARDGSIRGQTEELKRVGVSKVECRDWGEERVRQWWGGNWNACRKGGVAKSVLVCVSLQRRCC